MLYSFLGGYGAYPDGQLLRDDKGTIYGATAGGGWYNDGAVFKLGQCGREKVLYSFRGGTDGRSPNGVIADAHGNLYGTTTSGGAGSGCYYGFGCGTVFMVTPSGKEKVLYRFKGGADGGNPYWAGLTRDSEGNLYGTTSIGGIYGAGTVFKLDTAGQKTILHNFAGSPDDGSEPAGSLVLDETGILYGTTSLGGNIGGSLCSSGCGTVFKLELGGKETVLYKFTGTEGDGANPYVGVALDAAGDIYGTTQNGGQTTGNCYSLGCGVVFMLNPSGKETILHTFTDGTDGAYPNAPLVLDASGNIYGAADSGGDCSQQGGCGTLFKITP